MEETTVVQFSEYTVVCHTEGCSNAEISIDVTATSDSPFIVCGVCGHQITDVTEKPIS